MYQRLQQATNHHYQNFNAQLQTLARALNTASPLATLNRGYAIVQKYDNQEIVRDARQLGSGDEVITRFSQSQAKCTVNEVFNNTDFDKDSQRTLFSFFEYSIINWFQSLISSPAACKSA